MACFEGKPIEFVDMRPEDVVELEKSVAKWLDAKMGRQATPFKGDLTAGIDPNMMMAQQIMRNAMGGGQYNMATPGRYPYGGGGYNPGEQIVETQPIIPPGETRPFLPVQPPGRPPGGGGGRGAEGKSPYEARRPGRGPRQK